MFCTRCARFNSPDTARCAGCGARLDWPTAARHHRRGSGPQSWFLLLPFALALAVISLVGLRTWEARQSQSAAYERAIALLNEGNLPAAIEQFGEAGGYRDAREQRITTQQLLAPYQAAFLDARAALDHGDNHRAVELLRSVVAAMPDNAEAAELLMTAEVRFEADLERRVIVATTNRDWLGVERSMLELATFTGEAPDEPAFSDLRLAHAPLLFTRNGALYRIGPDGGDEELIFDEVPVAAPLWSPDRERIAFFSAIPGADRYAALFIVDADGTNLELVDEGVIVSLPAWSPNGRQLAYVGAETEEGPSESTTLRIYAADTGESRERPLQDSYRGVISPSWSSDGTRLAAIGLSANGETELLMIDAESLEAWPILESTPANARSVSWSPTADVLLLWTTTAESDWYAIRGSTVSLISLERLSISPITGATQAPSRPIWAPDGVRFAYLDRGATLHVRVRTGIGDRTLALPNKGSGAISWGPGGVGIAVPALDQAEPSMIVPIGERLGPVRLLSLPFEDGWPPTGFLWGSYSAIDPALYDPFAPSAEP